jgi:hypothetical protein
LSAAARKAIPRSHGRPRGFHQWREHLALLVCYAAIPVTVSAPRVGVAIAMLCLAFFLLPQPKPRYKPSQEPGAEQIADD